MPSVNWNKLCPPYPDCGDGPITSEDEQNIQFPDDCMAGCTDPNAMNYNDPVNYPENIPCSSALEGGWLVEEYGGAILEEPVLITDCQENGSCVYGQYYEIWCCNYDLGGSFSTPCEDVAVYSEQAYESAMDSSYGLCQDTQELCISETPCTT